MSKNNLERYKEIKNVRQEVVDSLPEQQKDDLGEIRLRVSQIMMVRDKNLPSDQAEQIAERAINRYVEELHISNESGINGYIEGIHAATPNHAEIFNTFKDIFPDENEASLKEKIATTTAQVDQLLTEHQEDGWLRGTAIVALRKEDNDPLIDKILELYNRVDHGTREVVLGVNKINKVSCLVARKSRLVTDMNHSSLSRETLDNTPTQEYLLGAREVNWEIQKKIIAETVGLDDDGKAQAPFLCLTVHGKSNSGPDFIIGGKVKFGQAVCDPAIANWFKSELERIIEEKNIINIKDQSATVGINLEGDKYSGSDNFLATRYGDDQHNGFGELFQTIQIETDTRMRKKSLETISQILAQVLEKFKEDFFDKEALENYIKTNRSLSDQERLDGLHEFSTMTSDKVSKGSLGVSNILRDLLNIQIGDNVEMAGKEYIISSAPKELLKFRRTIFVNSNDDLPNLIKLKASSKEDIKKSK